MYTTTATINKIARKKLVTTGNIAGKTILPPTAPTLFPNNNLTTSVITMTAFS